MVDSVKYVRYMEKMENELVDLLSRVAGGVHSRLELLPVLVEIDLPPYQAKLLVLAARQPGASQQQLATFTGRDKAQVARAVKELEVRGLVTRAANAADSRAHGVDVTENGASIAARIAHDRLEIGSQLVANLSTDDQATLVGLLRQLVEELG
jgi:DNA-binding MarR family transcriptional regulator